MHDPDSLTGQYLSGDEGIAIPAGQRSDPQRVLKVIGATGNNLKNVTLDIPRAC